MQLTTYCALSSTTVEGSEKSCMRTTYQKKQCEIQVFMRMRFSCQKIEKLWVFCQCKRYNQKLPEFLGVLVFANVNKPICEYVGVSIFFIIKTKKSIKSIKIQYKEIANHVFFLLFFLRNKWPYYIHICSGNYHSH